MPQYAPVIDLATLNGTNGFRLDGIDANDESGRSVASVGDVNGDGFDDILVGAFRGDPVGDSSAGESYVVFGKATGFAAAFDLSTLDGTNGFRLDGIDAGDESGWSVASAGDVNGDGFDDHSMAAWALPAHWRRENSTLAPRPMTPPIASSTMPPPARSISTPMALAARRNLVRHAHPRPRPHRRRFPGDLTSIDMDPRRLAGMRRVGRRGAGDPYFATSASGIPERSSPRGAGRGAAPARRAGSGGD